MNSSISTNIENNNMVNLDPVSKSSNSTNSSTDTKAKDDLGGLSVMYYLAKAMSLYLKGSKDSYDNNKEDDLKAAIERSLEQITSINGRKALMDYLKKVINSSDLQAWVTKLSNNVDESAKEVDEAVKKFKEALKKLDKANHVHTHWYEPWTYVEKLIKSAVKLVKKTSASLKRKKKEVIEKMKALIADADRNPDSLKQLAALTKELADISKKMSEANFFGGWLNDVTGWVDKATDWVGNISQKYLKFDVTKIVVDPISGEYLYPGLLSKATGGLSDKLNPLELGPLNNFFKDKLGIDLKSFMPPSTINGYEKRTTKTINGINKLPAFFDKETIRDQKSVGDHFTLYLDTNEDEWKTLQSDNKVESADIDRDLKIGAKTRDDLDDAFTQAQIVSKILSHSMASNKV